jgi:hypothetical protein
MPLAEVLAHPDIAPQIYPSSPSSPHRAEIVWRRSWRDGEICFANHARITLEATADGRIERISWEYFAD